MLYREIIAVLRSTCNTRDTVWAEPGILSVKSSDIAYIAYIAYKVTTGLQWLNKWRGHAVFNVLVNALDFRVSAVDSVSFSGALNDGSASVQTKTKVLLTPSICMQSVFEYKRQIFNTPEKKIILKIRVWIFLFQFKQVRGRCVASSYVFGIS